MVGAELLFLQMEGKKKFDGVLSDMYGNKTGTFISTTFWNISYIALPVYYGFRIKKFNINLGGQASVMVASSYNHKSHIKMDNGETDDIRTGDDLNNIDRFDFGPRAGLFFDLSEKFALEANYYFGLNDIISGNHVISRRNQQLTVGLRYKFLRLPKNK